MNDNRTTELLPCPFCSAEPEVLSDGRRTWGLVQHNEGCLFPVYPKHEIPESDFAAWNTRAAYEMDGWFYLPKPKERLAAISEPSIEMTENGVKSSCGIDVFEKAVRKWREQIERESEKEIIEHICDVFKPERTCHRVLDGELASKPGWHIKHRCSECGEKLNSVNYCPNCGAKVVGE